MSRLVPILVFCAACHSAKEPTGALPPPPAPEHRLRAVLLPLEGGGEPDALMAKLCSELQRFQRATLTCPGDLRAMIQHAELKMLIGSPDAASFGLLGQKLEADRFVWTRIDQVDKAVIVSASVIGVDGKVLGTAEVQAGSASAEDLLAAMTALAEKIAAAL